MDYNWKQIKRLFKPDGSLRDIYIQNITIYDWKLLVNFLERDFERLFDKKHEINIKNISEDYVEYHFANSEDIDHQFISIKIDDILINCHLYDETEIEFDIDPKEIKSNVEFDLILKFMNLMRLKFQRSVKLTDEMNNRSCIIIIHADGKSEFLKEDGNMEEFKFNR